MKIGCKIESVVGVNFKILLAKIVNLIFKYILSSYFVECGWRCSKDKQPLNQSPTAPQGRINAKQPLNQPQTTPKGRINAKNP